MIWEKELYYVNNNVPNDEIYEYYKYDRQNNMLFLVIKNQLHLKK